LIIFYIISVFVGFFILILSIEYAVALLMNLCLRTNGRKQCAEISEQITTVLSTLLTHPNKEVDRDLWKTNKSMKFSRLDHM